MKPSPLAAAILHHVQTERGSLFDETLEADVLMLPWFKDFKAGEVEIQAALFELASAGKVRRWTEKIDGEEKWIVEAIPESEWPENNQAKQTALF